MKIANTIIAISIDFVNLVVAHNFKWHTAGIRRTLTIPRMHPNSDMNLSILSATKIVIRIAVRRTVLFIAFIFQNYDFVCRWPSSS